MVPLKKNPQRAEGSTNMDFHPRNRSWAVPKHKQSHPNFDWTKANSFQVKTSVTDGNEVIPKMIANPKETTPKYKKNLNLSNLNQIFVLLPAVKKLCPCHLSSQSVKCSNIPTDMQA